MRILTTFLILLCVTILSCTEPRITRLSDNDLVINSRLFSPDKKYVVYDYSYDIGALGYSRGSYAIVKTTDTTGIINKDVFDCLDEPTYACYTLDKWLDNTTLQVKIDPRPFFKQGISLDTSSFKVGDVEIKVTPDDVTYGLPAIIEHYAISPDKEKLLVAYRYSGVSELNISAINLTDSLPVCGNIFTCGQVGENPILYGRWTGNNEISIVVDEGAQEYFQSQLSKQKNYNVKIVTEKYVAKYSGIQGGWYNKDLHSNDNVTLELLKENITKTKAVVQDSYGWGDSYYTKLINYSYEYNVNGKIYKSYFRATKQKCKLEKGDSIELTYNTTQPIIHQVMGHNSR